MYCLASEKTLFTKVNYQKRKFVSGKHIVSAGKKKQLSFALIVINESLIFSHKLKPNLLHYQSDIKMSQQVGRCGILYALNDTK